MALAWKNLFGPRETTSETTKDSALTPQFYFSNERATDIESSLRVLSSVSIGPVTHENNEKGKTSVLKVEFDRDGKLYRAIFTLERENAGSVYRMTAEVVSERGKTIFKKTRISLDALQVPMAITFVFHEAFEQNK
ncbi:hypothetical protein HZC21_05665 [Candidatus Peregrinibacteria bacterium]|nr:hypothetical protein [Candidatus Peregrinibacteria bacterium]